MTHINSISCGQGAPSLFLIVLAGEGLFPADVVITADTGWESDMLWSTGERTTAREFWERVTRPLAASYGIDAAFVRSRNEQGEDYPPIPNYIAAKTNAKSIYGYISIDIPVFGSNGGRLKQSCTSKWKVQAIRQELRRRGATTATTALGLHSDEVHRCKPSSVQWDISCWPLVDMTQRRGGDGVEGMGIGRTWRRIDIQSELARRGISYLVTTECDGCPHKDWSRWQRTSPQTVDELAQFEAQFNGEFFLTSYRKPLREALALMEQDNETGATLFDGCDSGYCFL